MEETAAADKVDPIHQFGIINLFDFGTIGGVHLAFTNSALFMVIAVVLIGGFLILSTSGRALVPGPHAVARRDVLRVRRQACCARAPARRGCASSPSCSRSSCSCWSLNVLGLMPYFFTVTSHIVITAALALTVILTVIIYGFYRNGLGFLKLFVPHGVPGYLLPLVVAIEVLSFLSRPISLSVRLFANMLAGHITLKVFASFIIMLERLRLRRLDRRDHPLRHDGGADRARSADRLPAGLCLRAS